MPKTVRVERPFNADELIAQTRKCKKQIELCLMAGGMTQPITFFTPNQFAADLRRFRKGLEPSNRQHEELTLVLNLDRRMVEFRAKPLS